jgi:hypothetical protein
MVHLVRYLFFAFMYQYDTFDLIISSGFSCSMF